ncbi:MAG: YHYH protein [Aureispira sp.]
MKQFIFAFGFFSLTSLAQAQLNPAITSWLQNNSTMGTYYISGNSNAISNNILVNCQRVEYSATSVYVTTKGIPAYPTGPFLDGNPSQAQDQAAIFEFPLMPTPNTGPLNNTTGGNIGVFINGVALFDYRDGVAWNSNTNALCGGPGNPPCPGGPMASMDWNRDAVPAERPGFDCSKGHPARGNYHHHQNPSAFKLDQNVLSTICNLYDADGLYAMDSTQHSPLIGFAYDGYPIYGAYGYADTNGTGGITRMKSGYSLRNITTRTHHANGTTVNNGPVVNATYPIGYFREDYEFISNTNTDYLDEHNGRFCITPEYPNGTYAYFCTVNSDWTSAYPYAVGPTFYGNATNRSVTTVTGSTTVYLDTLTAVSTIDLEGINIQVFPNPASDLIAIQIGGLVKTDMQVTLLNLLGQPLLSTTINQGQTIAYFDVETLYAGAYLIKITSGEAITTRKVLIKKE